MATKYRTSASNTDGGTGVSRVPGGLEVQVSSPLDPLRPAGTSDPEQLLALAWATCLNATAQAVLRGQRRTAVRVDVELADATDRAGYEFHMIATVSAEGLDDEATRELAAAAHERCPVSRLLHGASTVQVTTERYAVA